MNQLVPLNATPPMMPVSDVERIAKAFAQSGMFGVRDPAAAMSLCLLAQAEGQHPAIAFRDYSIIQGRPAKKAEAMQRDFLQSGGKIEWLELSDECVKAKFSHPSGGSAEIDWTMDRAKAAGLGGKDNWKKFPRQMLRSRVISEGVRTVCPMATSGLYVPEEVAEFDPPRNSTVDAVLNAPANETVGEFTEIEAAPLGRDPTIPGITKIRNNLNKLRRDGAKATELEAFNELVHACKDDLQKIKDAGHSLWTGSGEDWDGFRAWIKQRREELTPKEHTLQYQMLVSCVDACTSSQDLRNFLNQHGDAVGELDGEESRAFEAIYDAKYEALKQLDTVTTGA